MYLNRIPERNFVVVLGEKLRRLRKEQNMTQLELARQVGITNGQISTIERGVSSPSIATLHKVAGVLGVPMADFFEDRPGAVIQVTRRGKGRPLSVGPGSSRAELLSERLHGSGVYAYLVEGGPVEVSVNSEGPDPADYFLSVLDGQCNLQVNAETYALEAGDSASVKARQDELIRLTGTGAYRTLIVSPSSLQVTARRDSGTTTIG